MQKILPYIFTIAIVLLVGCFKLFFNQVFQLDSPLLLFYTSVAICAWFGGGSQGLLATALVISFMGLYFIPSGHLFDYNWIVRLSMFTVDCLIVTMVCSQLRKSKGKVDSAYDEIREVEMSLRKTEGRLSKIFASNIIGLVFSDFTGKILDANDAFINMLQADRDLLKKGKLNWKDFTPPEYMDQGLKALEDLKVKGMSPQFEKVYLRADGTRISVVIGAARVDENTIVAFVMDISERTEMSKALRDVNNQLEQRVASRTQEIQAANEELSRLIRESAFASEQLHESRSFLDSVIQHIPNMIFVKDAQTLRFVRFNKAGEELLGLKQEQLVGKNDYDFFPKEQADFFTDKDRNVLAGKNIVDIPEEVISTPTGQKFLHTRKIPVLDGEGVARYLLGISEDITEKKELEKQRLELMQAQAARLEAERSTNRLSLLAEASAALNQSLDIQTMIRIFARVVTRQFTQSCTIDFFDRNTETLELMVQFTRDGRSLKEGPWGQVRKLEEEPSENIKKVIASSDSLLEHHGDTSTMLVPLVYHNNVFGVITLVGDRPYDNLDVSMAMDLARKASFAIENARLYAKAQEASRAKSAFLANISHEIRTPLGAMLGFAELTLENGNLTDEQMKNIKTIHRNGQQLLRIVDEVLDLSKVESDHLEIEQITFSLPKVIEEVISLLKIKAQEKGLVLNTKFLTKLPKLVRTDPLRLRQILINMVGNALKFTEQGQVEVSIGMTSDTNSKKSTLSISVADSGIGISEANAQKLFQPFVQADGTMTRKFGGTGLGLFLSRRLARLLGGDVVLKESIPGKGSVFLITVQLDALAMSTADEVEVEVQPAPVDHKETGRILIVDDASENRTLVNAFLSKMGYVTDMSENGAQGLKKAISENYDVILMDIQMPVMDGFEAVKQLREKGYSRPIVALTAHAMKGDRERCLNGGFDDYLCKPLTRASLADCLKQYIH